MKFIVLGSGGALRIPRACCNCKVCNEARIKGFPYKRMGQSLYLYDEQILFDTPEDINEELNSHEIDYVKRIIYSHWHPDHTMGCRIVEILAEGKRDKIDIFMPSGDIDISINDNALFKYYEAMNYCNLISSDETILIGEIIIKIIKLDNNFSSAFLITKGDQRILYCPCHTMHLPISDEIKGCNLFITCKGESSEMEEDITNFERDTLRIIREIKPHKTIITHIEESDNFGFDDYVEMEKELIDIQFAYDGMVIDI